MSKNIYILILLVLSQNYLVNNITKEILTRDTLLIMQWVWYFIGLVTYRSSSKNKLNTRKNKIIVIMFFLIFVLSTLSPIFKYNQSLISTLISQRFNYSIFTLIILLYIFPKINDVLFAINLLSIVSIFLFIISVFSPTIFINNLTLDSRLETGSTDVGISGALPGFMMIIINFYVLSQKAIEKGLKTTKELLIYLSLIVVIFLIQNRQTVIIIVPILIYTLFKMRTNRNFYKLLIISLLLIAFSWFKILVIFDSLRTETIDQLSNDDYNRWQAIYTYLFKWDTSFYNVLFGNGINSKGSSYSNLITNLNINKGAYLQDIGFFGSYFYYGIFFVLLNYYLIFKGFFKNTMPLYLRFWCFGLIILPVFQNWGMNNNDSAVVFSLLFYMIIFFTVFNKVSLKSRNENNSNNYQLQ